MDQLTLMAKGKGGPDAKRSSKKPSVNPRGGCREDARGAVTPPRPPRSIRAPLRHHEEALEHLTTKDKHANENLKLTDQEKSELEQLEDSAASPRRPRPRTSPPKNSSSTRRR